MSGGGKEGVVEEEEGEPGQGYLESEFSEKAALLEGLVQSGIADLLSQAAKRDALDPPFGRAPQPHPLWDSDSEDDDDEAKDEPVFDFQYGFDPLTALANYLHRKNPVTVAKHEAYREECKRRLVQRSQHADQQINVQGDLQELAAMLLTGVSLGPICNVCEERPGNATVWARGIKEGKLHFELAGTDTFDEIYEHLEVEVQEVGDFAGQVEFTELPLNTSFFVRVHLEAEGVQTTDVTGMEAVTNSSVVTSFVTPPELFEGDSFKLRVVPAAGLFAVETDVSKELPRPNETSPDDNPDVVVLAGGLVPGLTWTEEHLTHPGAGGEIHAPHVPRSFHQTSSLLQAYRKKSTQARLRLRNLFNHVTEGAGVSIAFNDPAEGAEAVLKEEETIFSEYQSEMKRYERKKKDPKRKSKSKPQAPSLHWKALLPSLQSVADMWPLTLKETSTRHMYHTASWGKLVDMFVMDTRFGYFGKYQASWLKENLLESRAAWRIVVCVPSVIAGFLPARRQLLSDGAGTATPEQQATGKSAGEDAADGPDSTKSEEASSSAQADKRKKERDSLTYVCRRCWESGVRNLLFVTSGMPVPFLAQLNPKEMPDAEALQEADDPQEYPTEADLQYYELNVGSDAQATCSSQFIRDVARKLQAGVFTRDSSISSISNVHLLAHPFATPAEEQAAADAAALPNAAVAGQQDLSSSSSPGAEEGRGETKDAPESASANASPRDAQGSDAPAAGDVTVVERMPCRVRIDHSVELHGMDVSSDSLDTAGLWNRGTVANVAVAADGMLHVNVRALSRREDERQVACLTAAITPSL